MTLTSIIVLIVIGLIAGWLAGVIWKGRGFGLGGNLIVGIVGSFLGGFLFKVLGISFHGLIGSIIAALIGALILLYVIGLVRR